MDHILVIPTYIHESHIPSSEAGRTPAGWPLSRDVDRHSMIRRILPIKIVYYCSNCENNVGVASQTDEKLLGLHATLGLQPMVSSAAERWHFARNIEKTSKLLTHRLVPPAGNRSNGIASNHSPVFYRS